MLNFFCFLICNLSAGKRNICITYNDDLIFCALSKRCIGSDAVPVCNRCF